MLRRKVRRLACDRRARSLRSWVSSSHWSNATALNRSRGNNSRTTRATWGRVIWGIFSPPVLLEFQQEGTGQETHRHVVMPPRPPTHFILIQTDVALAGLELRLNRPPARRDPRQRLPRRLFRSVGEGIPGLAPIQVPAVDQPQLLPGLALARLPHPFEGELVGARPLGSLAHRELPPPRRRQPGGPLRHGLSFGRYRSLLRRATETRVGRRLPGRLLGPDRRLLGHFEHVPKPGRVQAVAEVRRHAEGIIPGDPPRLQRAPGVGRKQQLQRQLGLRTIRLALFGHSRRLTAGWGVGPLFRQIEPFVDQGPASGADV